MIKSNPRSKKGKSKEDSKRSKRSSSTKNITVMTRDKCNRVPAAWSIQTPEDHL
jgi:hypothetical protein